MAVVLGVCGLGATVPAWALDANAPPSVEEDGTPADVFRAGTKAYFSGDKTAAVNAFGYAADKGHPVAQWKLGRMYQEGDGVAEDDYKAFELFTEVANAHADDAPNSAQAPFVANAFVELGTYYLNGIKDSTITPNVERARELFTYAASYFGDADAQYRLGRLYLTGEPTTATTAVASAASNVTAPETVTVTGRDPRLAARWLKLAAEKGHPEAQALLGKMLVDGSDIRRNVVAGLMWLTVARNYEVANDADDWIRSAQEEAFSLATEKERHRATELARSWIASNANRHQ